MAALGGLLALAGAGAVGGGLAVAAYGVVVAGVGLRGALEPDDVSVPLGALIVLAGIQVVAISDEWRAAALLALVAVCVGLFALATRTGVLLSGVATVALTAVLPQAISHFGGESVPLPAILLVTGLALLGGAALTSRMRR